MFMLETKTHVTFNNSLYYYSRTTRYMFMPKTENSCYFQKFQQFSSLQHQNFTYSTCSCRKRKTHVTLNTFSNCLHYKPRTTHNTWSCRTRKTQFTFKTCSNSLYYNTTTHTWSCRKQKTHATLKNFSTSLFIKTPELTHDTCSCRKRKRYFQESNCSNSNHYNSSTTHDTCSCRIRKTHVTFRNCLHFSSLALQYYT